MSLLRILQKWRLERSRLECLPEYRILPNRSLEEIVSKCPQKKEDLLFIYGIGDKKIQKYGERILSLVQENISQSPMTRNRQSENEGQQSTPQDRRQDSQGKKQETEDISQQIVSVGEFLDRTNAVLAEMPAAVRGEISSADVREGYVFFSLKDANNNALLSCFMWRREYDLCGVPAQEGTEVIVRGYSEIYKPSGRLSFRVRSMELVGEGALRAAYDRLKKKLEDEGLFSPERKRSLPDFPRRIGLITSREGAVIHDFMSNIGTFGFRIRFAPSRVEGALAVSELLAALRILAREDIEVLVLIRGGGSLESLAAFNNEALVRAIAAFPVPVLCGIGHDKDVPLATLVADKAVSTPTATARELCRPWEGLIARIDLIDREIRHRFERVVSHQERHIRDLQATFSEYFSKIVDRCRLAERRVARCFEKARYSFVLCSQTMDSLQQHIVLGLSTVIANIEIVITSCERTVRNNDPVRQLQLGYGILFRHGKVVRSVEEAIPGEMLSVRLSDGRIETRVHSSQKGSPEKDEEES